MRPGRSSTSAKMGEYASSPAGRSPKTQARRCQCRKVQYCDPKTFHSVRAAFELFKLLSNTGTPISFVLRPSNMDARTFNIIPFELSLSHVKPPAAERIKI